MVGYYVVSIGMFGVIMLDEIVKIGLIIFDVVMFLLNMVGLVCEGVIYVVFEVLSYGFD